MEFIERVDEKAVAYLLSQLSAEYVAKYSKKSSGASYTTIKNILTKFSKNKGVLKVDYEKSLKDTNGMLRDYSCGIQALPKPFRGLLAKRMIDIDMVNCHPKILENVCKKFNVFCPYLSQYCERRDTLIAEGKTTKTLILTSMNSNLSVVSTPFMTMFDTEMKQIQKTFMNMEEFKHIREYAISKQDSKKKTNVEGTFMSCLTTSYETSILYHMVAFCKTKNIEIGVLMFDGFMVYSSYDDLCIDISLHVKKNMGFDIQYIVKPHNNDIVIPDDWVYDNDEQLYADLKRKYENDYGLSFIQAKTCYSYKFNKQYHFYTIDKIRLLFTADYIGKHNFFDLWLRDQSKKVYVDVDVCPHDVEVPDGILNLWTGYAIESCPCELVDIDIILNHLRILFNNETNIYEFVLDWIANMLQYPSGRSVMIALKSLEGTGKSRVVDFLSNILGKDKSLEIDDPAEDMFGSFNDQLSSKVFLNVNETSKKDFEGFYDKLKTKITSTTINIKTKGLSQRTERNLGHYILTTNNDDPIKITEGSRRFFLYETSNILIGNDEYFKKLSDAIDDKKIQYSFFKAMMTRKVKHTLNKTDIPITKAMLDSFVLNRDPVEDYAMEFTNDLSSQDNYTSYKQFLQRNGYKYDMTKKAFDMKFAKYYAKHGIIKEDVDVMVDDVRVRVMYKKVCLIKLDS